MTAAHKPSNSRTNSTLSACLPGGPACVPLFLSLRLCADGLQPELTSFLRKANRQLRSASLVALEALLVKYGKDLAPAAVSTLVPEAAALISDAGTQ